MELMHQVKEILFMGAPDKNQEAFQEEKLQGNSSLEVKEVRVGALPTASRTNTKF